MKKICGMLFLIIGLTLIGRGTYSFFEEYDLYLIKENNKNNKDLVQESNTIEGNYVLDNEIINVKTNTEQEISVAVNNETYNLKYNGEYYENSIVGLLIRFDTNSLIVTMNNEEPIVYYKQK